ncbi:gfo/Idh/MocA family oxidoreductase [Rhizobium laguerreae]|uniref:Gfo/Idh/MocA family protein n=1 Tax=Rhizobium laguerreae TaxID=1076926 RepID=UPI00143F9B89|nr:Gfo/Idh/MocA family oxidoreductase [Rhizobium laguerreae]NKM88627.1 gfo/Idh/MocA family oxidoreductase [Rhizobium laguerreae]
MKVGIIGTGFTRDAHIPSLLGVENVEIVAVTSARLEKAQSAAIEFGIPHAYDEWQEMLTVHDLDFICVSTPVSTHFCIVKAALTAGAHVLCDTPAAMNFIEARSMADHARDVGRQLLINHELRYNPKRLKIRQLIHSGAIGKLQHIRIQNVTSAWNDPAGRAASDWWSFTEKGGGRLLANAPHQIDLLRWWGGKVGAVSGRLHTVVKDRLDRSSGQDWTATADDFCEISIDFQSGATASVSLFSVSRNEFGNHVQIFGTTGTMILDEREQLRLSQDGRDFIDVTIPDAIGRPPLTANSIWAQGVAALLPDAIAHLTSGRPLPEGMAFQNAIENQIVLDAVRRSSNERRTIDLRAGV